MHSSHGNRSVIFKHARSATCCSASSSAWTSTCAATACSTAWTQTPSAKTPRTTSQPRPCRAKPPRLDRNGAAASRRLRAAPLGYDKPLCASLDGFTLHAATRAGALDPQGREKLLCYVLRPPIANKRIERRPDGLVRIALKRAFADGTVAVEMDPLSLLCRLATSVPPPRFHTVKYAGVLAPASNVRARIKPQPQPVVQLTEPAQDDPPSAPGSAYRAWAELLKRSFDIDVLECPKCHGRMKLIALVLDLQSAARYLAKIGERVDVPGRSMSRGPPYWKSTVLRRKASHE